jgi:hypothetical protein
VATTLGYKIAQSHPKGENKYKAVSVDVTNHVRHMYSGLNLDQRVVKNSTGGSSKALLTQFLSGSRASMMVFNINKEKHFTEVCEDIDLHGTSLLSRFWVDGFFREMLERTPPRDGGLYIPLFDHSEKGVAHKFISIGQCSANDRKLVELFFRANTLGDPQAETGSPCIPGVATSTSTESPCSPGIPTFTSTDTTRGAVTRFHDGSDGDAHDETLSVSPCNGGDLGTVLSPHRVSWKRH